MDQFQRLVQVVLGDSCHERPAGEVPVEKPQWPRRQRQTLREHVEREPVRVQSVHFQRPVGIV